MNEKNSEKLLLDLALHRYDEEVERNDSIDNKNKSMVAFLAVMLTIQCTVLPRLIEFRVILSSFEVITIFSIFLISLGFYLAALLVFMSTLNNLNQLRAVPNIETLVDFDLNNSSNDEIVSSTLVSLNNCVDGNDKILDEKNSKGHFGLRLMKYGVGSTVIFIIYVTSIII